MLNTFSNLPGYLGFFNIQGWDYFFIFLALLLLFGAKRLPDLARSIGRSMKEFRSAATEAEESFKSAMEESDSKPAKKEDDNKAQQHSN